MMICSTARLLGAHCLAAGHSLDGCFSSNVGFGLAFVELIVRMPSIHGTDVMNFRQLDLNLLRVLCAVHRTGSVTEAARQLALSQPATSNALARLRSCFGDALFVRSPSGLHPTRLAQRVVPVVAAHLRDLETLLASGETFDPATGQVHWRLSLSDLGEMMFLPPLAQALLRESPSTQVSNVSVAAALVSAALEARDIDLAIGILLPEHSGIASESLFHENFVAITARQWRPAVGRPGKNQSARQ